MIQRKNATKAGDQRDGFTLVEMMVSMALVLFTMVLLTQAFATAYETFRTLKSIGDMENRLRTVSLILRKDLTAQHLVGASGPMYISDDGIFGTSIAPNFPTQGFFRISQANPSTLEGTDGDTIGSYTAVDHLLHFTVQLSGDQRPNYFLADISKDFSASVGTTGWAMSLPPGSPPPDSRYQDTGTYTSQWAEVAYFLVANGSKTTNGGTAAAGNTLYSLYRRQLLAVWDNTEMKTGGTRATLVTNLTNPATAPAYVEISCKPDPPAAPTNIYFNTSKSLVFPQRRFAMDPTMAGVPYGTTSASPNPYPTLAQPSPFTGTYLYAPLAGADLILADVLSFNIQVIYKLPGAAAAIADFADLPASGVNTGDPVNALLRQRQLGTFLIHGRTSRILITQMQPTITRLL